MSKKGQLTTGLVFGVATLVVAIIIAFVVVSTIIGANLLTSGRTTTTVTNETGALATAGDTLNQAAGNKMSYTLVQIWGNDTGGTDLYDLSIPTTNATVGGDGVVKAINAGAENADVLFTYTYITKDAQEWSTNLLSGNFTAGVDNVSAKIPTILLVAAIVIVLGLLVLLVGAWQRMRAGSGI